jgi:hypothetical protein
MKRTDRWAEDKLIQKDICFECGSMNEIQYHHIVPFVKGGTKTIPLCVICHGKVHDKDFVKLKELQKIGYQKRHKENPWKRGRIAGSNETFEVWMEKPKTKQIAGLLKQKYSIRYIAKLTNSSTKTVQKVKNKIGQQ